jgi:hypothetical protein
VDPRTGPDAVGVEKNSQPLPGLEHPIIQPVAQRYNTELYSIEYSILVVQFYRRRRTGKTSRRFEEM